MNINIFFVIMVFVLIFNIAGGYKKGMVRQLISFVSMIILCVIAALAADGMKSYVSGEILNVFVIALLLCALGIVRHLLGVVFFSARMVSGLPIIHGLDKIMGIAFGILETVLILWTIYIFTMIMDLGAMDSMFKASVSGNQVLEWLYRHNYLAYLIENIISIQ
ncbi:MAG: CvpA family protein [Lachnospiraceae bacterium]|nr:CvpA family protein [Lachnospiraceae bacterium]